MAPEYALWGYLTYKADVYSFGIVALEIVVGKSNMKYRPDENFVCLMDWVRSLACSFEFDASCMLQNPYLVLKIKPRYGILSEIFLIHYTCVFLSIT